MAKMEHLMSDLKSGGETYFRKIYTQEHTFKKIFYVLLKIERQDFKALASAECVSGALRVL